ncbi:hypothetical protein Clacol_000805 [Clathrus columnatus]|uniref:Uncharacterized protein n=1 Tax=Clathrus columnatus TaxID=1419009 RepID=A0AAV4ZZM0_9AGAM|nr:hypothetical protein Clacol_000805 [Clathrus columnatus]
MPNTRTTCYEAEVDSEDGLYIDDIATSRPMSYLWKKPLVIDNEADASRANTNYEYYTTDDIHASSIKEHVSLGKTVKHTSGSYGVPRRDSKTETSQRISTGTDTTLCEPNAVSILNYQKEFLDQACHTYEDTGHRAKYRFIGGPPPELFVEEYNKGIEVLKRLGLSAMGNKPFKNLFWRLCSTIEGIRFSRPVLIEKSDNPKDCEYLDDVLADPSITLDKGVTLDSTEYPMNDVQQAKYDEVKNDWALDILKVWDRDGQTPIMPMNVREKLSEATVCVHFSLKQGFIYAESMHSVIAVIEDVFYVQGSPQPSTRRRTIMDGAPTPNVKKRRI